MRKVKTGGGFPAIRYTLKKAREAGGLLKFWRALRSKNTCKTCAVGMGGQLGGMVNEGGYFPEVCKKSVQAVASDSLSLLLGGAYQDGEESDAAAVDENLDQRRARGRSGLLQVVYDDALGNSWQAGVYHQRSEVDSALRSMLGGGRFRSTTALDGQDRYESDIVSLEYRFGGAGPVDDGVLRAYLQQTDIYQRTYDERGLARRPVSIDRAFSFQQDLHGFEANLQKRLAVGSGDHHLGFGVEYRQRRTAEYRDGLETDLLDGSNSNTLLGEVFPLRDFPISKTTEWGAYLEDVVSLGRWSVIGALRADWSEMRPSVDAMYREDYPFAEPVDISESNLSPKLGVVFRPSASTEIWWQYAHGFRAPPYEDANISLEVPLFNYRAIPNPDLKPEQSNGVDIGLRWRGADASADLSVFRTEYDDFIESRVRLGPDPESGRILFQAQNVSQAVIEGVEAGAEVAFGAVDGDGLNNGDAAGPIVEASASPALACALGPAGEVRDRCAGARRERAEAARVFGGEVQLGRRER